MIGTPPWVPALTDSVPVSDQTTGMVVLDVAADVQSFLAGTAQYHGWLVRRPVTVPGSLTHGFAGGQTAPART